MVKSVTVLLSTSRDYHGSINHAWKFLDALMQRIKCFVASESNSPHIQPAGKPSSNLLEGAPSIMCNVIFVLKTQ